MSWPIRFTLVIIAAFSFMNPTQLLAQMPELVPLKGTGQTPAARDPNNFVFFVAGDNRPKHKKDPQPPIPGEIFAAVSMYQPKPAFVFWTGDTIYGKDPDDAKGVRDEYREFLGIAKQAGVPVYNAPGNHEMDDADNCPNDTMKDFYEKYAGQPHPYGAFTYGNSRFIALDSDESPPAGMKECSCKSSFPGYVSPEQLDLLKADLDANQAKAHIFVFLHRPLEPAKPKDGLCPASTRKLKRILAKYPNVSYVVAGHEHMYYNVQSEDGLGPPPGRTDPTQPPRPPFYLVSGGAGAPLKSLPGGFYHYLVFRVSGNTVSASCFKVDGTACPASAASAARR